MKKLNFLAAMLLSLSMVFFSCTKTDGDGDDNAVDNSKKDTLLTAFEMTTPLASTVENISYNDDLNLDKIVSKNGATVESVKKYNYNGSLLLDCKWYSDEAMTNPIGSNTYTFNTSGDMTAMVEIDGADTTHYTISYAGGKISEYTAVNISAPFNDHKSVFEWTGDNITKSTNYKRDSTGTFVSIGWDVYTYDDKVNPMTIKSFPEFDDVVFFSKNNYTKIETYGPSGAIQSMSQFTYNYDANDMPTVGTFDYGYISGQMKYTYTALSKP